MRRIKTAFLIKRIKEDIFDYVLELVESSQGTYYLIANDIDYQTGEFKKTELFKSHTDLEEVDSVYNSEYQKKIEQNYAPAQNGAIFNGLKFLLDYTENYINKKDESGLVEALVEQPRIIKI